MSALVEELPDIVLDMLSREYGTGDGLKIAAASDITGDGSYGERWLVVNAKDLLVLSPNGDKVEVSNRVPLRRITGAATESLVGIGVLEAHVDGHPMEVIRFSNSLMGKFNRVAKHIEAAAKDEEAPPVDEADEPFRCEGCGRLLDNWSKVCPKCINRRKILARLIGYILPYKGIALTISLFTLLSTMLNLAPPYFTKLLIDNVLIPSIDSGEVAAYLPLLNMLVFGLVAAGLLSYILTVLRGRMAAVLGSKITYDVRTQLYERLQRLSLSYFDKRQVGAVMTRVTQDTNQLSGFLVEGAQHYVVSVLQIIGISAMLIYISLKLGLLVIIPAPLLVIITILVWRRMMRVLHHFWHSMSRLGAMLNDALTGIRVVKAFGQEDTEISKFSKKSYELYDASLNVERLFATIFPTLAFVTGAGSLLVWWFGGRSVMYGELTPGDLMAFFAYIGMFYGPLQILSRVSDWMSRSFTSAERIFEVMDTVPDIRDDEDAVPMPDIKGDVKFNNVSFGYDKHKPVLKDVTFDIKAGEMVGLVGHSGAGKSTTINLICRFYDVNGGAILVDGVDIRKIKLEDLRSQIGVVLQDPFLFNGTIAENIAYGSRDAKRDEIIASAKAANAHEFIMKFADGYDTIVRERGQRLSGGERQRISIARAILRNPRILVLDEATSSVDTETEKQLQEAISLLVKDRTTFAIAHRLSTLRNADRLLVIENGKFVEFGTHEELLKKKGVYYKLVQLQKEVSKIKAVDG